MLQLVGVTLSHCDSEHEHKLHRGDATVNGKWFKCKEEKTETIEKIEEKQTPKKRLYGVSKTAKKIGEK